MNIQSYLNQIKSNGRSEHNIKAAKQVLTQLDNFKPLNDITKDDLVEYFLRLKGKENTRRMHQVIVKKFFKDNEKPELVNWIVVVKPKITMRPDDTLTADDVNKMLEAVEGDYWKAWIAFAFESGARFNEIRQLRYKDFKETDNGMIVEIKTSKTAAGYRRLILPLSTGYIRNLKMYASVSPDDAVFPYSEPYVLRKVKEIAAKSGIEKPISPHKFRHGQATDLVRRGFNETIIRKKLGWTASSSMVARYIHESDDAVIEATLANGGKLPEKPVIIPDVKQADKVTLVDAAMQFSKLSEENATLKTRSEELEAQLKAQREQNDFIMRALKDKGIL